MKIETAPRAKHTGRIVASIIGAIATALSLIIGFIAIIPILTQSSSALDKLEVQVEAYRARELTTYLVPLSTQLSSFPLGDSESCTDQQRAWLDSNGTAFQSYFLVTISNRATSGGVLGFSNIVSKGSTSTPSEPAIIVECDTTAESQPRIAPARLKASGDLPAYYDRSRLGVANSTPDTPLIYNLQPGESGQFILQLISLDNFEGAVVYTATAGTDSATIQLNLGSSTVIPGTSPIAPRIIRPDDPFWTCILQTNAADCVGNQ